MTSSFASTQNAFPQLRGLPAFAFFLLVLLAVAGCHSGAHTSDPQLRKIDTLLDVQLPKGTPMTRVIFFLSSRGYPMEDSRDPHAIVTVIRHIDTDTLQPITARVTFHFDEHDKLLTYELAPAQDTPLGH
jgi:hypothetical protein